MTPLRDVGGSAPREPALVQKRVILIHRDGMQSIAGAFDPAKHELKPLLEYKMIRGTKDVAFGLIKVTPRAYYYREIVAPPLKNLKEFDPRQV